MPLVRRASVLAAAAAAVLALASCSPTTAPAAAAQTRTVTDVEGTPVVVPAHPRRVVTLSEPTLDGALALGVVPIGTVSGRGQSTAPGYLLDKAADIPVLGGVAQPNYEAIGTAKPDLLLVDGTSINNNAEAIAVLRRIAPVVVTGYAGGDWRANFTLVADALGRADEGAQVLADYDAHVADVKAQLGAYADDTFSIVRWQGSSASLILEELPPGQALTDLGLARPASQDRRGRGHSEPVSLENLADIDADYIFFGTLGGSSVDNAGAGGGTDQAAAQAALDEAAATPGFTDLTAWKDGHVVLVDGSLWTSTGGPLLMTGIVDAVRDALVED
ncbi:MAG TPA: iron-siderophore ABC transporter substrate-binding protein [Cellulomonas sp.]|nr:iron-siderophore ABC transporter substrate-binding protein [Cellulomonas sp.]